MQDDTPDRPPTATFLAALNVRQNAIRGFGFSTVFTLAVFVLFVVVPGFSLSSAPYVALGVVLLTSLGALVTTVLTAVSAYRLAQEV